MNGRVDVGRLTRSLLMCVMRVLGLLNSGLFLETRPICPRVHSTVYILGIVKFTLVYILYL